MDKIIEIGNMVKSIKIFPQIREENRSFSNQENILFETYIRKKHTNGKYYLCLQRKIETFSYPKNEIKYYLWKLDMINHFNINNYIFLELGIVIPNGVTIDNEPCFILDSNQEDEKERIKNIFR